MESFLSEVQFFSGQDEYNVIDIIIHGEVQQAVMLGTTKLKVPERFPKLAKWFDTLLDEASIKKHFTAA